MNLAQLSDLSKWLMKSRGKPAFLIRRLPSLQMAFCFESRSSSLWEIEIDQRRVGKAGLSPLLIQEQFHEGSIGHWVFVIRFDILEAQGMVHGNRLIHLAG